MPVAAAPPSPAPSLAKGKKRARDGDDDAASANASASAGVGGGGGGGGFALNRFYFSFVLDALEKKRQGNMEPYDELVSQFTSSSSSSGQPAQVQPWLEALSHVVSQLDRSHAALVDAIVSYPWTTAPAPFASAYAGFVAMLVSARTEYLRMILGKIVKGFTYQSGLRAVETTGVEEGGKAEMTRREVYDRLHALLERLLALVPAAASVLKDPVERNFPHKRESRAAHVAYIRNVLRVVEYCDAIGDAVLSVVVKRTIDIDVQVQAELEDLDEDEQEAIEAFFDPTETDPFDRAVGDDEDSQASDSGSEAGSLGDLSSDDGSSSSGDERDPSETVANLEESIAKLDGIMSVIFAHFERVNVLASPPPFNPLSPAGPPSPSTRAATARGRDRRRAQFHGLLAIFEKTILKTFKSRYTQFLLFWYSSLDPDYSDLFQGMLVSKALFEPNMPVVIRLAAASYTASYVSRAKFVDGPSARRVMALFCDYLASQLDAVDGALAAPNVALYSVFYAVAQAVFYIFCFRWRDLLDELDAEDDVFGHGGSPTGGRTWAPGMDVIQRAILSPFNPLRVCSSNVVHQFARVAQGTGFLYCHSIIEQNKRSDFSALHTPLSTLITPPTASLLHAPAPSPLPHRFLPPQPPADADLDSFFPFDPYKLPRSGAHLRGIYREWGEVAIGAGEEDEGSEEEDEGEEVLDEDDEGRDRLGEGRPGVRFATSLDDADLDAEMLGKSIEQMSISPNPFGRTAIALHG